MSHYDYIIIGAGASGLLLADALGSDNFFASKSILVIDKEVKTKNDRTWCFWETGDGIFDHLLEKSWSKIYFAGDKLCLSTSIAPYSYKMIRAMDFYSHYNKQIQKHPNITRTTDEVTAVNELKNGMEVVGKDKKYACEKVFNSIFSYESLYDQKNILCFSNILLVGL